MSNIEKKLSELTEMLVSDYEGGRIIDEVKSHAMPDKKKVIDILEKIRIIVFAGYFRNGLYKVYTVRNTLTMLLEDVTFNLGQQIAVVLSCSPEYENAVPEEVENAAEYLTFEFLSKLPKIRALVETDVKAAYDGDPAAFSTDEIIYSYPGLYAIVTSRIAHELFLLGVPLIPRMMTEHAHSLTGIDIHPGTTIGEYFFIDHGTGIVIGETTEIGNNVKIYQGVTLGALSTRGGQSLRGKKRHPTIKDNVTIYSGASILGGDTIIGKDVVIGGNAFITSSIPDGARVSIKNQELTFKYSSDKGNVDDPHASIERREIDDETWFYII
ncbi:serine O-acetyltransferase [Ruminococcus sp. YE71]|uniref:serine O-acetyltransferase n=1 Tax=unclassified Ruminococcus TaxID=2608920 RepID=UPI000882CA3D|nr:MULTISPECIES: serine acetyltransferase [unclassified Ruminococcus]SDA27754.1 serine O-acetyltransferase [Ruminococcus sp. YE78]SFW46077.1 serine O-acetyltransferase [Ruminococcus sp. YE71]